MIFFYIKKNNEILWKLIINLNTNLIICNYKNIQKKIKFAKIIRKSSENSENLSLLKLRKKKKKILETVLNKLIQSLCTVF
jgi:hypothetical protein